MRPNKKPRKVAPFDFKQVENLSLRPSRCNHFWRPNELK